MNISKEWEKLVSPYFKTEKFRSLANKVREERKTHTVYPEPENVFRFLTTDYKKIKVVIIGQDPYHDGQATGLSFECKSKINPSLYNIFEEIDYELGMKGKMSPNLDYLKEQGVLLLNRRLTVRKGQPNSHRNIGWEEFTDYLISQLVLRKKHLVWLLWGKGAQEVKPLLITNSEHLILESSHPSPYSFHISFKGNGHFIKTNNYLKSHNLDEINWTKDHVKP